MGRVRGEEGKGGGRGRGRDTMGVVFECSKLICDREWKRRCFSFCRSLNVLKDSHNVPPHGNTSRAPQQTDQPPQQHNSTTAQQHNSTTAQQQVGALS